MGLFVCQQRPLAESSSVLSCAPVEYTLARWVDRLRILGGHLTAANLVIEEWRVSLRRLYDWYEHRRPPLYIFYPALFLLFVLINDLSYWLAMVTAFPELLVGQLGRYYFKIQFPVATLGALFDSLSFFVTLYLIRRALTSQSSSRFLGHLSVDLVIALLATLWVLFVFSFSSWLVRHFHAEVDVQALASRQAVYQDRVLVALRSPTRNLRNIYFGLVMGTSAMIPSCVHITMAVRAILAGRLRAS